jgi:light-regulated signal transduction histidine kinase (bacteriophytochrome)
LKGFQPVTLDGNRIGTLYLEQDRAVLRQRLVVYAGLLGLLAVLSFGLAYGLTALMQRGISGPLQGLTATAQAAALGDYTLRAERLGSDELGVLTDAFNHMLGEIQKLNVELEARVHRRTAQLESANQELEAFSYSVSHDLRAPLRHIDGFAQLLQKHLGAGLDETGRRYLQTIADSAKRLGILIDELLVFSRMARTELRQLEVPMGPLVEEAIRSLQPDVQGRNVAWAVGDLPVVRADAAMLRQVWVNLLSNAVKYTRRQAAARIEIAHRLDPGDGHVFSVRDNGAGFDMQYVDKLFGVFQRLHPAAEFEGTGIGLANVQRIIQRHHGRVWAEGRVNGGATFHFTLPRGPELA